MREKRDTTTRVAAVLTAYNRRDLTLACLRSLRDQQVPGVAGDGKLYTRISREVVRRVGNIDPAFVQQMGDFDRRWAGRLWPLYWLSPSMRRGARLALERTPLGCPRRALT